jgi:hypothetical protein
MQQFDIPTRDLVGEQHPLAGVERPDEVRERISETLSGRELSEEWRERVAEGLRGNEIPASVRAKTATRSPGRRGRKRRDAR